MYILINDCYKYFNQIIYLNYFLIILLSNIIINIIPINIKYKRLLADNLIHSIQLNGAILIKMFQHINVIVNTFFMNNKSDNNISDNIYNLIFKNKLDNLYENCTVHDINYTKNIFLKEYNANFDDIIELDTSYNIKSGSIAQVYKGIFKHNKEQIAIKVVHPDIQYQLLIVKYFFKYTDKYFSNIISNYLFNIKNISKIMSINNFIKNINNQIDMNIEKYYLDYFYNEYKDEEYIEIPKPIFSSNNLLIMNFVDGLNFEDMEISDYNKQKISLLNILFYRDLIYNKKYIHADLHIGNIKVQNYKKFYKLIIYDFGFCLPNNFQQLFKNMDKYIAINNYKLLGKLVYNTLIINSKLNETEFMNDFNNYYINQQKENFNMLDGGLTFFNYMINNNYPINIALTNIILASASGYKYSLNNSTENNYNTIYTILSLLKQYNIFPELKNYHIDLLNDDTYKNFVNTSNLLDTKTIIDISYNNISI